MRPSIAVLSEKRDVSRPEAISRVDLLPDDSSRRLNLARPAGAKYGMTSRCKGSVHCHAVDCAKCSWRYAGRIATRIDASRNGSLYAITIDIPDASPSGFRQWRTRIRNRLDYLRTSTLWRNVGLHVWLCRDGKLRGVISFGTFGSAEVLSALSRWPMALREIGCDDLWVEIYDVVKPSVISMAGPTLGRYRPRKLSVWPCRCRLAPPTSTDAEPNGDCVEPMPILL
jgi:hypothetical protein